VTEILSHQRVILVYLKYNLDIATITNDTHSISILLQTMISLIGRRITNGNSRVFSAAMRQSLSRYNIDKRRYPLLHYNRCTSLHTTSILLNKNTTDTTVISDHDFLSLTSKNAPPAPATNIDNDILSPEQQLPSSGAATDSSDNKSDGFSAFVKRQQSPLPSATQVESIQSTTEEYSQEDQYHHQEINTSKLQEWHSSKEIQFNLLTNQADTILSSSISTSQEVQSILSLMEEITIFQSSITTEMYELSTFRKVNPMYPPSNFMSNITYDGALKVEALLSHLLSSSTQSTSSSSTLTPSIEVQAYIHLLKSYSQTYHIKSGDYSERILEIYGEKYGGDMNYMPNINCYKFVLEGHLMSCSSFTQGLPSLNSTANNNNNDVDNDINGEEGMNVETPGEKAISILNLLSSVYTAGDIFLKPDLELYSLTISVLRNSILDWLNRRRLQYSGRDGSSGEGRRLEMKLSEDILNVLELMEYRFAEVMNDATKNKVEGVDGSSSNNEGVLSLNEWSCMIRAYTDALAIAGRIPLDNAHIITGTLLNKLEKFITDNSSNIVASMNSSMDDGNDVQVQMDMIQRNIEESYTSALSSGLKNGAQFPGFNSVLSNATTAEEVFNRMVHNSQQQRSSSPETSFLYPTPTYENYRALIKCWCECVRKKYSTVESNIIMSNMEILPHLKAISYLHQLEEEQMDNEPMDGAIYGDIIWAWGHVLNWPSIYKVNDYNFAANASEQLIYETMEKYNNGSIYFYHNEDALKMYHHVFRLHSKMHKGGEIAVKRSLKLLDHMEDMYRKSKGIIAKPDEMTFALILKTISNSGVESSASNAAHVIKKMEDFDLVPSERHYLGLIRAHSRVKQRVVSDPGKADAVLQHVKDKYKLNKSVKPTTEMYTACIAAYGSSRQKNSISRVMELFEELKQLYKDTNDIDFRPDSQIYGVVIDAISKAKSKDNASLRQAIQLLEQMEKSYEAGEIEEGPNRYAYTNLFRAISQSNLPGGEMLVEDMMNRMDYRSKQFNDDSISPDVHTYTTVIQCLSKSRQPDAAIRAEKMFKQMEQRYDDGDEGCKPNKVTCTALINCWMRSGHASAGVEAENLLSMMETRAEDGDFELRPDAFVYSSVINTWASSKSNNKAAKAWGIYERMKAQYAKGNMEAKPNEFIVSN